MTEAVLRIRTEGGAEVSRFLAELERAQTVSQSRVARAGRAARAQTVRETQQAAQTEGAAYRTAGQQIERAEKLLTRSKLRELALRGDAAKRFAAQYAEAEKKATSIIEAEVGKRGNLSDREKRQVESLALAIVNEHDKAERRATAITERETRRRTEMGRRFGRGVNQVMSGAASAASNVHGQFQSVRERAAARETSLDSILLQTSQDPREIATSRALVMRHIQDNRLDPETAIAALGEAQGRFNALGGETSGRRQSALQSTLQDVNFASVIDPSKINGLVAFGAMLRNTGIDENTRQGILRNATGISFQGSVETDEALRSALPGMLRSLSSATAGARPEDRNQITQSVVTDFLAQIQSVAATGGRTTVTANRINTLRTALSNDFRQDRIGQALSQRQMTEAQRAEFSSVFQRGRDGRYAMSQEVVNSPSRAAALFGHLFNNNATAVSNFLGAHGGGGNRQLLNRPEVGLLTSYFADSTDAQGRSVKQYDAEASLARATITPEREAQIRAVRAGEDRLNLNANENARQEALSQNTLGLRDLSNKFAAFTAGHPLATAAVQPLAGVAGGLLPSLFGRVFGSGAGAAVSGVLGRGVIAGGLAGAGQMAGVGVGGLLAGLGLGEGVNRLVYNRRDRAMSTTGGDTSILSATTWRGAGRGLMDLFTGGTDVARGHYTPPPITISPQSVAAIASAMRAAPLVVQPSQHDTIAAHTVASTRPRPP